MKAENTKQFLKRKRIANTWMWISFAFWWLCGFMAYGLLEFIIK